MQRQQVTRRKQAPLWNNVVELACAKCKRRICRLASNPAGNLEWVGQRDYGKNVRALPDGWRLSCPHPKCSFSAPIPVAKLQQLYAKALGEDNRAVL